MNINFKEVQTPRQLWTTEEADEVIQERGDMPVKLYF